MPSLFSFQCSLKENQHCRDLFFDDTKLTAFIENLFKPFMKAIADNGLLPQLYGIDMINEPEPMVSDWVFFENFDKVPVENVKKFFKAVSDVAHS